MSAKELAAVLKAMQGSVADIEYRYVFRSRMADGNDIVQGYEWSIRRDDLGRVRSEGQNLSKTDNRQKEAWNGERLKYWATVQNTSQGTISADPSAGLGPCDPLFDSVLRFGLFGYEDVLSSYDATVIEQEGDESDAVYVLRFDRPHAGSVSPHSQVYWLSARQGLAPVRVQEMRNGKVITDASMTLREVLPGLWLPFHVVRTGYPSAAGLANVDPAYEGAIQEAELLPPGYVVNKGSTMDEYDFEFPSGTDVTDRLRGKRYVVGKSEELGGALTQPQLDKIVAAAQSIVEVQQDHVADKNPDSAQPTARTANVTEGRHCSLGVVGICVGIILLTSTVLILWLRYRRR